MEHHLAFETILLNIILCSTPFCLSERALLCYKIYKINQINSSCQVMLCPQWQSSVRDVILGAFKMEYWCRHQTFLAASSPAQNGFAARPISTNRPRPHPANDINKWTMYSPNFLAFKRRSLLSSGSLKKKMVGGRFEMEFNRVACLAECCIWRFLFEYISNRWCSTPPIA